jgi:hypothetical protein
MTGCLPETALIKRLQYCGHQDLKFLYTGVAMLISIRILRQIKGSIN